MSITRRHLLALSAAAAGAAALGVGGAIGGTLYRWWDRDPGAGFAHLAPEEAAFLVAFAGAAFPGGAVVALDGAAADLDRFFDGILDGMPDMTRTLLKLLLQALDAWTLPFEGAAFGALPLEARQAQLQSWISSDTAEIRGAAQSLLALLGMGYTSHPQVAPLLQPWFGCPYGR